MHQGGLRIALVVDHKSTLLGIITDGDIRRSLLNQKSMDTTVNEVMNNQPITASITDDRQSILRLMDEGNILHVPILDSNGFLVDLETIHHLIQRSTLDNPVMIMAGGYGTRLLPLTKETPKPFIEGWFITDFRINN